MFKKGEYVVYGSKGVCLIADVTHLDMMGSDKDRLYYILHPIQDSGSTVYLPTDSKKAVIRPVISSEEARQLIDEIPDIEQLGIGDDKKRESKYKEAMKSCDCRAWVSIIKTLCTRKKERLAKGKKITALDEKYLRAAEHELYDELSIALDIPQDHMEKYVMDRIEQN